MDSVFFQQLINGLSMGSIYALIAVGYSMVYGILNMINFAHGEIYMLGAYMMYACLLSKLGIFGSILISMTVCAVSGMAIERIAYRPLRNVSRIIPILTALAAAQVVRSIVMIIWGSEPLIFPPIFNNEPVALNSSVKFFPLQILIIGIMIVTWLFSLWFFKYTKIGKAVRAVSQDQKTAWLMGIQVNRMVLFVYAYGSILAAIAGVLVANYYILIFPLLGFLGTMRAWTAAVLGGIGNLTGAIVGGLLLGLAESFTMGYISTGYRDAVTFIILIVVLLVKPTGLFKGRGQKV
ncbi:MAG TPA: branched-chain amino acid ABC transporter permease [Candidatus Atribacteria bacterium]|jgi:branched-chain amino acid transport system permease protein|nr:MAG: High-affinity branched-chain amino acid ABC transporter system permease protein LivH [Atribacteria bacterium 34_128]HAJ33064.1 branched-chain amino acid ABC transporter permease [Candidatus Atribacteria bacterium]